MNEENKSKGWIRLYRSIKDNWLWENKPFTFAQAWIDILLRASYDSRDIGRNGQNIPISPGSFITSTANLADDWGWTRSSVRRFLKRLTGEQMIDTQANNKWTTVSVINWAFYQDGRPATDAQPTRNRRTTDAQPTTKNKEEKEEEEKKSVSAHSTNERAHADELFNLFWEEYPRKVSKGKAKEVWYKINPDKALTDKIVQAVRHQKENNAQWIRDDGKYITYPNNWLATRRWEDDMAIEQLNEKPQFPPEVEERISYFTSQGYSREEVIEWIKDEERAKKDE